MDNVVSNFYEVRRADQAPVIRTVETIAEAEKLFDPIAYNKGRMKLLIQILNK